MLVALTGGAAALSAYAPLDGAVVAAGTVAVEGSVKKIQHPTGGVVGEIAVAEGGSVTTGDLLVRLDDTIVRANLDIVLNALRAERARLARLQAMRDGRLDPVFPADLTGDSSVTEGEARLCRLLLSAKDDQKRGLLERVEQLRQEIRGFEEQQKSTTAQQEVVNHDLTELQPLYERGNVQRPRISALRREMLRNQGALGDIAAQIAQSKAKIAETDLQITQGEHDFIAGIVKELREAETRIAELQERKITADDQLRRLDIRAPLSGTVHQLAIHTIGGVVSPSDVLMLIVPSSDRLIVEIRIRPSDIDQLVLGQETRVRFPSFNRRTTDELHGVLSRIAADLTEDPQSRLSYYSGAVHVPESERAHLEGVKLVAGMPAEVFIKTGGRTLASYIVKPLSDQMQRALRER